MVLLEIIVFVQSLSQVQFFGTLWSAAWQTSLSFSVSQFLLRFISIESVMLSNHLILCHPLLFLPSIFPSIRVFSNEPALCNRWSKYWSFSGSISRFSEYSGLISFRMKGFDFRVVQGNFKSLPQHQFKSISSLVLSLLYGPTLTSIHGYWKNHSLDLCLSSDLCPQSDIFAFYMLSRFVVALLQEANTGL